MKKTALQFIIFAMVGAVGTALHYAVLLLSVEFFGISPLYGTSAGFAVGAITNYLLNYHITFRSNKPHSEALLKFATVALAGALLNSLTMYAGIDLLQLHYMASQLIATILVLIWNYIANKLWTFSATRHVAVIRPDNHN